MFQMTHQHGQKHMSKHSLNLNRQGKVQFDLFKIKRLVFKHFFDNFSTLESLPG